MELEFVADTFTVEQHKEMDRAALASPFMSLSHPSLTLLVILTAARDCSYISEQELLPEVCNMSTVDHWYQNHPLKNQLHDLFEKARREKNFRQVRLLKCIQKSVEQDPSVPNSEVQWAATVKSWEGDYRGSAPQALWAHIKKNWTPNDSQVCAHYLSIVQSSGMGKSRLTDEVAKSHFVIPICLRGHGSKGFPPPDKTARDILVKDFVNQDLGRQNCRGFLSALFDVTTEYVKNLREGGAQTYQDIAANFRSRMVKVEDPTTSGEYRQAFYQKVDEKYKDYLKQTQIAMCDKFRRLVEELKRLPGFPENEPVVTIVFDEAHDLSSQAKAQHGTTRSNFGDLRRELRQLIKMPLFSLFLSTTGKFTQFGSYADNVSMRVSQGDARLIEPFSDLGFDYFVPKLSNRITIHDITRERFMVHFGRPLFASRYKHGDEDVRRGIITFAASKLLNRPHPTLDFSSHSRAQKLAVLSQRLPIEFFMTNYLNQDEMTQVEGHLRVCLKIDSALQSMRSVSASEPLLSEAAFRIMQMNQFDTPKVLLDLLQGFSINKGDRGELIAMLLLTLARDAVVCERNPGRVTVPWSQSDDLNRSIPVVDFIKKLFNYQSLSQNYADAAAGSKTRAQKTAQKIFERLPETHKVISSAFEADFQDAILAFSHFIKVQDHASIQPEHLSRCVIRQAGVAGCANQKNFDLCLPMLMADVPYNQWKKSYIFVQIKNDVSFPNYAEGEFDLMGDPKSHKLFKDGDEAYPFIRILFSLAGNPMLKFRRKFISSSNGHFTAYDIWCGGLKASELPLIGSAEAVWQTLLQISCGWDDIYREDNKWLPQRARQNPSSAIFDEFNSWCDIGDASGHLGGYPSHPIGQDPSNNLREGLDDLFISEPSRESVGGDR